MLEHLEELGETLPDTVSKDRFKVYLEVVKSLSEGKDWDISLEKQEAVFALYKKNQDRDFGKKAVIKSLVEHLESLLGPVKLEMSSSGSKMTSYNYSCMGIIDAFDGDNFSCFLKKFEAVVSLVPADGSDIDSKVKAKLLVSKLSPSVIERLLKFSNVDLDDYKQLIGALKDLYREKVMSTVTVRMKLTSLKRGDFRSIEEYGKEIIKLAELLYSDSKTEERDKMVTGELCAKFGPSYLTACENNAQWIPEEVLEMIVAREKRHNFGMNTEKRRPMNNREGRNDVRKCWNCGEEGHERRNCNANVTSNASMEVRSSNKVYIKGQLVGNSKVCFVDSGADGSLMDYDTYLELMTWGIEMTPCESLIYWGDICEVNRIRILGIVNVVENSEVMKSLKCNMVIGGDNLSKYEYVQNLKQRFVSIDGERIDLMKYQGSDKMVNVSMENDLDAMNVTLNILNESNSLSVKDKLWKEFPLLKEENRLGRCTFKCPKIPFQVDCVPPKYSRRFFNAEKQQCIDDYIDELIKQKVLVPSDTNFISHFFVVPKPSGGWRPVVDLRSINQLIQPDSYPIKTLSEIFRQLDSKMLISKLDLNSGFHQIPMNEADCRYFGIMKGNKVYEYTVIPQGMRNATQLFQRCMDLILGDEENVICYVDDILVFTENDPTVHYDALSRIINKLLSYDLSLNLSKSVFCAEELEYLGHVVTQEGRKMRDVAIQGVVNKNYPTSKKAMRQFLGAIGWYREFIRDFSIVAAPLTDQLAKNAKVVETTESSKAFAELKSLMLSAPILQFPNYKGEVKFILECDASCSGFGAMLAQNFLVNDEWKLLPIAFWSKRIKSPRSRLPAGYLELQSIILALKRFYCYTSDYLTIVYTDHKPLLNIIKDTSHPVLQRWIFYIQDRNIQIRYKPGRLNTTADYLSRGDDNDGCLTMCAITKREDLIFMVKSFLKDGEKEEVHPYVKRLADNSILEPDGTLYWKINLMNRPAFKVPWILPRERLLLMKERHIQGHFSADKGIAGLKQMGFWPFMYSDYKNYVETCMLCQKRNVHKSPKLKSHIVKEASRPFEMISLDLCGPLPCTVNENLHLLNIVDNFTRFWLCFPVKSTSTSSILEKLTLVISMFGCPDKIRMDNASGLCSKEMLDTLASRNIVPDYCAPSYKKGNSLVERSFRTTNSMIYKLLEECKMSQQWDEIVFKLMEYYNNATHVTLGESPFYLMFIRDGMNGKFSNKDNNDYVSYAMDSSDIAKRAREIAKSCMLEMRNKAKSKEKVKDEKLPMIKVDDMILVKRYNNRKKLDSMYDGPFKVVRINDRNIYYKRRPNSKITYHAHITQVKLAKGDGKFWVEE
uniref:RNA-directed DNA polymerase n=1 Tax=Strongyloides papillosus TaxID=174720 RepID=A0A0N5B3V3_STREA